MSNPDIFDLFASQPVPPVSEGVHQGAPKAALAVAGEDQDRSKEHQTRTAQEVRKALQYVLANGWLEAEAKPQLFRLIAAQTAQFNALLEPLDLRVVVDDVRGLAFLAVAPDYDFGDAPDGEQDDWTHPLMRRQRLNLEQSLLLAILRREFLQTEQESGTGTTVRIPVDSLLPHLQIYLGATGSDMQERKRLGQLLENLRTHGMVSDTDAQECITIRPMIVHLLNPENLQALLLRLSEVQGAGSGQ